MALLGRKSRNVSLNMLHSYPIIKKKENKFLVKFWEGSPVMSAGITFTGQYGTFSGTILWPRSPSSISPIGNRPPLSSISPPATLLFAPRRSPAIVASQPPSAASSLWEFGLRCSLTIAQRCIHLFRRLSLSVTGVSLSVASTRATGLRTHLTGNSTPIFLSLFNF